MSKQIKVLISVIVIVLVLGGGAFAYGYLSSQKKQEEKKEYRPESSENASTRGRITYEGKKYKYNTDLKNILFLGVDKKEEYMTVKDAGRGGQSDCIILLVMNQKTQETKMLQVSRDSMVDVKMYDISGDYLGIEYMQITTQYAFGDGRKRSCQLSKEAVSELLYEIPIQSYIALNIEGIGVINDAIGGVNLTVPKDYTSIDPAFEEGKNLTLNAAQAEKYVRYRDITQLGSNDGRMERQTQFIRAMFSQLKKTGSSQYDDVMKKADPYMITDMSIDQMKALSSYEMTDDVLKVPGKTVAGEEHDEYHVDDKALQKMIVDTFYVPVD